VDFLFIIALVGGTGTSLALTTPMVAACASKLLGVPESFWLDLAAFAASVALIATSVYLGLDRGIKRLSDINVGLAGLFLLFVLLAGPTFFLLKLGTNSIGLILQNFIRMNTWTEPIRHSHFVENWTIFYWAWWIAYGPFMGLFVTRISRGRTLKQLILSMVGFGALGCAAFYIVMGNTAMWMDMRGMVPVQALVAAGRANDAIAQVMAALPWQPMPLVAFIVMALVFAATTYDSASYAIASAATRYLAAGANPHRWHRVFWAFALAVLPITLIIVGGLHAILSAVLVASLPLLIIGVAMIVALFKSLRAETQG
jgi:BCCT family betaine/carnitine transporter